MGMFASIHDLFLTSVVLVAHYPIHMFVSCQLFGWVILFLHLVGMLLICESHYVLLAVRHVLSVLYISSAILHFQLQSLVLLGCCHPFPLILKPANSKNTPSPNPEFSECTF